MSDLKIKIWGKEFKNPIWSASGCFGYGTELADFFPPSILGAVVTKGISLEPWKGNPPPRVVETPSGMINSIGLENVGFEKFAAEKMPVLRGIGSRVVVNFLGHSEEEYEELARRLGGLEGADALELNLSCPNVNSGGLTFGANPKAASSIVAKVKAHCANIPLIAKLSPNTGDIAGMARACEDAGADGISLVNTLLAMAIDVRTRRPILKRNVGGLSGPAIKPAALRMTYEAAKAVKIPVIGMGGISSGEDVAAFMIAGASAAQVGTAAIADPMAIPRIIEEFAQFCREEGVGDVSTLIKSLKPY
jgi:dihydroorotate dehydrogenase (NAD+) catalytic subunit